MKKIILTTLLILTTISICIANDADDMLQAVKKSLTDTMPFYQNMNNCNPYQYKDWGGLIYKVYGIENNACHIQRGSQHCYYPLEINKKYSAGKISLYKRKIATINQTGSYDSSDSANDYFATMDSRYCRY